MPTTREGGRRFALAKLAVVLAVLAACGVPGALKDLPVRDQQCYLRCEEQVFKFHCGYAAEEGLVQSEICIRRLRKDYAAEAGGDARRSWLMAQKCPPSVVGPAGPVGEAPAASAPAEPRLSTKGESCARTADCAAPLRCRGQLCVQPPQERPAEGSASQPTP